MENQKEFFIKELKPLEEYVVKMGEEEYYFNASNIFTETKEVAGKKVTNHQLKLYENEAFAKASNRSTILVAQFHYNTTIKFRDLFDKEGNYLGRKQSTKLGITRVVLDKNFKVADYLNEDEMKQYTNAYNTMKALEKKAYEAHQAKLAEQPEKQSKSTLVKQNEALTETLRETLKAAGFTDEQIEETIKKAKAEAKA